MSDFNNNIPGGAWLEYDAAADWCAARGIKGTIKDPLPESCAGGKDLRDLWLNLDKSLRILVCGY